MNSENETLPVAAPSPLDDLATTGPEGFTGFAGGLSPAFSEITPLKTELPRVEPFDPALLPDPLRNYAVDVARRIGCPLDFVGVALMIAAGSLIGRKVIIHPKRFDSWAVPANLWGALIGRPSSMKSPAMAEALKPLNVLVAQARAEHQQAKLEYEAEKTILAARKKAIEDRLKKALRGGNAGAGDVDVIRQDLIALEEDAQPPTERRHVINDATVEKLGELLNENPAGLLLVRDELIGWLRSMDREDRSNDRAFYLEAFNGAGAYTYDRIGRGTIHIESTTLSILGGIQPSKLAPYIRGAISGGHGDDGLVQRLQLAVWPDYIPSRKLVDTPPDDAARAAVQELFERLRDIPQPSDDAFEHALGVRFTDGGQQVFYDWHADLMRKICTDDIHPAIESHLAKFPRLMAVLALVVNVISEGPDRSVSRGSAVIAAAWTDYLESHARRIYSGGIHKDVANAALILKRRAKLSDIFKAKDVHQKGWAGLTDSGDVRAALKILADHSYLRMIEQASPAGGRPAVSYQWNPEAKKK